LLSGVSIENPGLEQSSKFRKTFSQIPGKPVHTGRNGNYTDMANGGRV